MEKSSGRRRERERKGSRAEAGKARGVARLAVLPIDTRAGRGVQAPSGRGRGGEPSPPGQAAGKAASGADPRVLERERRRAEQVDHQGQPWSTPGPGTTGRGYEAGA